jgi:hypothetical protein
VFARRPGLFRRWEMVEAETGCADDDLAM